MTERFKKLARRTALLGAAASLLTACTMGMNQGPTDEGIGFRAQRFEEVTAMREYRGCVDEAVQLDKQAYATKSQAKYLASARLLESCEAKLGPSAASIAPEERMHAYGLSVQNYIKGGALDSARASLAKFETAFAGRDLYYADGSSFTETMGALLGRYEGADFGRFSTVNVNAELKDEMRRVAYWSHN